ncbi:MAG: alpha/beta fold hydrolase, partial [Chitinophagaceae bacterium]
MIKRIILRYIKIALFLYGVTGIALYFLQDYLIIRPVKLSRNYQFKFDMPFKEVNIPFDATSNINILQFAPPGTLPKGLLLYFHGNRTNVLRYSKFVPYFTKSGYEVWMIDYPGYGKSTGEFSEELVYKWSAVMYKLARTRFSADSIIIYGKSLGTGIAAQLASVRNCRYLVLETPYYNLPAVVGFYAPVFPVNRLIHYKFPTFQYLPQVTDPIVIFHGTNDWVVPYSNSLKLKPLLKANDVLITI